MLRPGHGLTHGEEEPAASRNELSILGRIEQPFLRSTRFEQEPVMDTTAATHHILSRMTKSFREWLVAGMKNTWAVGGWR